MLHFRGQDTLPDASDMVAGYAEGGSWRGDGPAIYLAYSMTIHFFTMLYSQMRCPRMPVLLVAVLAVTGVSSEDASAVEFVELYDVELPVQSRDTSERRTAFQQALTTVLIRMTGDRNASANAEVQALLKEPSRYVQRYRYIERNGDEPVYTLRIRFDGLALENALNRAGLPVWGKERPAVLVWIAVQQPDNRYLVSEESDGRARMSVDALAYQRGIPVIYPLLDVQDRQQVSIADVLGGFDETIRQASKRYQPDAILVARANAGTDGFWRVVWHLYMGDQAINWTSDGDELSGALVVGMHRLADALSERLAIASDNQQVSQVVLQVEGVNSLQDYARLNAYLADLGQQIVAYRPYRLESDRVNFLLDLRGNPRDLQRLIGLSAILYREAEPSTGTVRDSSSTQASATPIVLRYRLR